MPLLNADCPYFRCFIKRSYYTHNNEDDNIFDNAVAFAIQSVVNKIITFHVMFDFGMVRSRVPLSSIYWKVPTKDLEPHMKQLWDCFGEDVAVTRLSYLSEKRCQILLKDKTWIWGTYQFTVDWFNNSFSENPPDYKNAHVIFCDDGYLCAQPNNRLKFADMNWVTKDFPVDPKLIKVDKELINVETISDRWISEDGDSFYYDIKKEDGTDQTANTGIS